MIKQTVNEYQFTDELLKDEYAHWTYGATKALYDYYNELSDELGEDIELDRVAIRCDWSEYLSAIDAYNEHNRDDHNSEELAREWLEERTHVIDVENLDTSTTEYRTIKSILVREF